MQATSETYIFEPRLNVASTPLLTGVSSIDSLNLERIIAKSIHAETKLGWTVEEASQVADLYRIFLFLCVCYPNDVIVPPREVDEFWHLHILDTRNYAKDCQAIFGEYLHHFPYAGLSESTKAFEDAAINHTLSLVARHFPQVLGEA